MAHQSTIMPLFLFTWITSSSFVHCFQEAFFRKETAIYFADHAFKTEVTSSETECCGYCLEDASCMSVNFKTVGDHQGLCELNANILEDFPQDKKQNYGYCYFQKYKAKVTYTCHAAFASCSARTRNVNSLSVDKERYMYPVAYGAPYNWGRGGIFVYTGVHRR